MPAFEIIAAVTAGSAVVSGLSGLVWWARRKNRRQLVAWRDWAMARGLTHQLEGKWGPVTATGTTRGVAVVAERVTMRTGDGLVLVRRVRALVGVPLATGFSVQLDDFASAIRREFDRTGTVVQTGNRNIDGYLVVKCEAPADGRWLVATRAVQQALLPLKDGFIGTGVFDGEVHLVRAGGEIDALDDLVAQAVALAVALRDEALPRWTGWAGARGLEVSTPPSGLVLEGGAVSARQVGPERFELSAELAGGLPDLRAASQGDQGTALDDPVLDGRVIVGGRDVGALSAWLSAATDEEVDLHGPLLELVLGRGGEVRDGRAVVQVDATEGPDLEAPLELLLALAATCERVSAHLAEGVGP